MPETKRDILETVIAIREKRMRREEKLLDGGSSSPDDVEVSVLEWLRAKLDLIDYEESLR